MKERKKGGHLAWRLVICGLLLLWLLHAIFLKEGQLVAERNGMVWSELSRQEKWSVAWDYGPTELWRTLRQIPAGWFLLSALLMGATILLGVWRWLIVLKVQGLKLPLSRALEITLVAHFFNSFLLGSTGGDLMKAYYAARETHHKKTETVVTVVVDRMIGLLSMLFFACLMMLLNLPLLTSHSRFSLLGWVIVAMFAAGLVVIFLSFWGGLSSRWPQARQWLRRLPKGDVLEHSITTCREFGKDRFFLFKTILISMALNLVCVLQFMVVAHGLNLNISPMILLVVVPVIICFAALPITPSGLGVRENLFVYMLSIPQIGVAATAALSLSLLAYAGSLLWSLIGGAVYLTFRQKHHLAEVTGDANPEPPDSPPLK